MYGKELILDVHECDPSMFTREHLEHFFEWLCRAIRMERCDLHYWDYDGEEKEYSIAPDHLKGTSAIQFITTSNVTIHTLDVLEAIYLNVFSCKDFDPIVVERIVKGKFGGKIVNSILVSRL